MAFQMVSAAVLMLFLLIIPAAKSRYKGDSPQTYDDLPQAPSLQSSQDCTFNKDLSSIPSAARHESDLKNLALLHRLQANVRTAEKCAQLCCDFGPDCQYAWLFETDCYAVGCSSSTESLCKPYFDLTVDESTYMPVRRSVMDVFDSSDDDSNFNQKEHSDNDGSKHEPKPSLTVALLSESGALVVSSSVSITTVARESLNTLSAQPAIETPQPALPPTSNPPVDPHKSPGDIKLVDKDLTVAVDGNKVITLPENTVQVFASTWPKLQHPHYLWEKVFGPNEGALSGINQNSVTLSGLAEGKYGLKVTVYDSKGRYGEAYVNITVLPESHGQNPPSISISPSTDITFSLPTDSAILDASGTTGEGKLSFHWEVIDKPIKDVPVPDNGWDQPVLKLQGLQVGSYKFRLTVTDQQEVTSSSDATVTVLPEQDYPPTANAGDPVLIHLPNNEVTLSGKKSTDDKGIVKYKWEMVQGKQAEPSGINTAKLHVGNLEVGLYQFKLTVTDTIGQTDTAIVSVDVLPESNEPPVVVIEERNLTVTYPVTTAIVNGSGSYDEYRIDSYFWTQDEGPDNVILTGRNTSILRVSNLHVQGSSPTIYKFTLMVFDYANLNSSSSAFLYYYKGEKVLPVVDAGPDITITFPTNTAVLNGSRSQDGFGIVSYHWSRSGDSPAAGSPMGGSDSTDTLIVSDLINGTYTFTLEVINSNGVKNSDTVILTVKPDPNEFYLVQVFVDADIHNFTQKNLDSLAEQLVIGMATLDYRTVVQRVIPHGPNIMVEFYMVDGSGKRVNATVIVDKLTEHGQDFVLQQFHIVGVEETVCQNACSGQGTCDQRTKHCVCSVFWMENPIKAHFGRKISNCDWSLLYVILTLLVCVFVIGLFYWLCCCYCCIKRRRAARRRKVKYAILDHAVDEGDLRMYPRDSGRYCKTSLMPSDTETEEEVLFDSQKKQEKHTLIVPNNTHHNNISSPGRLNNNNGNT